MRLLPGIFYIPDGCLVVSKLVRTFVEGSGQLALQEAEVFGSVDLLSRWRVEEAAFAFACEFPVEDVADVELRGAFEGDVEVVFEEGAFAEAATTVEEDDEALDFVVGRGG